MAECSNPVGVAVANTNNNQELQGASCTGAQVVGPSLAQASDQSAPEAPLPSVGGGMRVELPVEQCYHGLQRNRGVRPEVSTPEAPLPSVGEVRVAGPDWLALQKNSEAYIGARVPKVGDVVEVLGKGCQWFKTTVTDVVDQRDGRFSAGPWAPRLDAEGTEWRWPEALTGQTVSTVSMVGGAADAPPVRPEVSTPEAPLPSEGEGASVVAAPAVPREETQADVAAGAFGVRRRAEKEKCSACGKMRVIYSPTRQLCRKCHDVAVKEAVAGDIAALSRSWRPGVGESVEVWYRDGEGGLWKRETVSAHGVSALGEIFETAESMCRFQREHEGRFWRRVGEGAGPAPAPAERRDQIQEALDEAENEAADEAFLDAYAKADKIPYQEPWAPATKCHVCGDYRPCGCLEVKANLSKTFGKGGVRELPAVRTCRGVPGGQCSTVLGPEVAGDLCGVCARYVAARTEGLAPRKELRRNVLADAMEAAWQALADDPELDPMVVAVCKRLRDLERGVL